MAKEKRTSSIDMTSGSPYRLIISFTLPMLLGNIFQQLYNMVDSIVVGNVIGDQALAAVGTGFPIIYMLSSLFMGIGTGATVMISQYYGARDLEKVDHTINTIYMALLVGVVPLTLIGVFLSEPLLRLMQVPDDGTLEMAKTYMIIIFIGVFRPRRSNFRKTLFVQAMRLGIPSGIQQALFSIGIMFMQSLVNSYGSTFMAGFNGANKIDTFAFLPVQSLSNALTTYTGQNIGAGNQHRVKEGLKASVIMSVVCCLVVGVLLYPTSAFMMRMFSQNPEVIDAGVAYLHGVLPFYFLLALSFMFNSVLRGAGDMLVPMISSFISLWLARLPAAYLLAYLFEKESIYYSYAIGWALGVIISGLYYATGKWKNKSIVARTQKEELA